MFALVVVVTFILLLMIFYSVFVLFGTFVSDDFSDTQVTIKVFGISFGCLVSMSVLMFPKYYMIKNANEVNKTELIYGTSHHVSKNNNDVSTTSNSPKLKDKNGLLIVSK